MLEVVGAAGVAGVADAGEDALVVLAGGGELATSVVEDLLPPLKSVAYQPLPLS